MAWLAVLSGGALASPGVTGPANNASVRFLVFGDWGGLPFYPYTTRIQRNLAKTMAVVAAAKRIDFVLSLGDNFYFKGVRSVDDRRFKARTLKRTFEDVYSAPSLQVPWLIVAGNHDHDGNVSAQIEYSKRSKRWHFPFYYYNKTYQIPGAANHTLDILMLDTVLLCGNTDPDDEESQPVLLNRNEALYNRQFRWINKILAQSERPKSLYKQTRRLLARRPKSPYKQATTILDQVSQLHLGERAYNYIRDFLSNSTTTLSARDLPSDQLPLGSKGTPQ
ncbi:tartrate-resistant acid phosphatase type 5-like, partial [Dermacentor albipictus]|uniref:tartrate-resistant acid phosphatase type 5-like n=1 Tax=Dermacentor albipictus TaxID=60249 RepID=UPI0038FD0111